ncbi:hypothetical protein OSTOST_01310, partial [Ostertagia ostertagi]
GVSSFEVLENLYQRCTDRLEYRTRLAQSALNILLTLPQAFHYEFVQRIEVFSKNQRVGARNYAIEIVPLIIKGLDLRGPDPGPIEYPSDNDVTRHETNGAASSSEGEPMDVGEGTASDEDEGDSDNKSGSESDEASDRAGSKAKNAKNTAPVAPREERVRVPVLPALYRCVIRSCLDKASTVRLRAMFHLTPLLENEQHRELLIHHARKMFEETPKIFVGIVNEKEDEIDIDADEINEDMFLDDSEIVIDNIMLHVILTGARDDTVNIGRYLEK